MQTYRVQFLKRCTSKLISLKYNQTQLNKTWNRRFSSFTRTEIAIPVPITGGHLAAQLWEGAKCTETLQASYPTPILFMHGFQDNSSSFDPLIPLLIQNNMTIVSVDQPGHGLSSHLPGAGYDFLLDGLATIHRVIRHFGWDKVTLIGHSFGSILNFTFTGTNANKIHKLVAIENLHAVGQDVVFQMDRTYKRLFEVETKLTDSTKTQPSYTFDEILQRTMKARKGTVTEEGVKTLLARGAVPDSQDPTMFKFSHDLKTNIPSMFGRFTFNESLQIASNIKCPVCVIKGDPGEDYEPRENFMKIVNAVKSSTGEGKLEFHLIPGTHHLHLNEPSIVAPIISNFLNANFE